MKEILKKSLPFLMIIISMILIYYAYIIINREIEEIKNEPNQVRTYDDIYNLIKQTARRDNDWFRTMDVALAEKGDDILNQIDFSDTNLQVLGVQEADMIKTDGNYIYLINNGVVYIISALDGELEIVSEITLDQKNYASFEMYIYQNKLIILQNIYSVGIREKEDSISEDYLWGFQDGKVGVSIYDITAKSNPIKDNQLSQSGYYLSSRMIDNQLYLISNYYIYEENIEQDDETTFIPMINNGQEKTVPIRDIYIMPNPISSSYLIVSSIDVLSSNDFKSVKSVLGSGTNLYASLENLYIATYDSETNNNTFKTKTSIIKFSLNEGNINFRTSGSVDGYILNQFSMDEYDNYFRIVTTTSEYTISNDDVVSSIDTSQSKNNLYVLDGNLRIVGKLENLAPEERVYSVRFDLDIAYFVTFREVDPLFTVDLTVPTRPTILSELKIPGFSEYLHVYNQNYLFGLGKETNNDGQVSGIKISMFDISNKSDVSEKYKLKIGNQNAWTEASYNHKAILISPSRNLIGFPVENSYYLFNFEDLVGFNQLTKITLSKQKYYYYGNMRGLYIEEHLYIFDNDQLASYSLEDFNKIDLLILNN